MSKNTYLALTVCGMALMPFNVAHATSVLQPAPVEKKAPEEVPKAFFVNLKNNDKVHDTFTVKFGIKGMKIAPAGQLKSGTGHFHLLIDTPPLTEAEQKNPIPKDGKHLHFGAGQTEVNLTLPAGKHTLQIVMGDGAHKVHNPPVMSDVITVNVQ